MSHNFPVVEVLQSSQSDSAADRPRRTALTSQGNSPLALPRPPASSRSSYAERTIPGGEVQSPSSVEDPGPHPHNSLKSGEIGERLYTAIEVANRLGVSDRFVRDHVTRRKPKIRALKLGSCLRFRWSDVETFLDALDTAPPSRGRRFGV
jgi:excisionase family DNA binding protein